MAKHVFPNRMVAHVWAQRNQDYGKSGNGNFSFRGDNLYSYHALIGRFVQNETNGETVALISNGRWSVTTSAHQSAARSAVPAGIPTFCVPDLGTEYSAPNHASNLKSFMDSYAAALAKARRARDFYDSNGWHAKEFARMAARYAAAFNLPDPGIDTESDWQSLLAFRAERESRLNTPEKAAKRERDRTRRAELKLEREKRAREQALRDASDAIAAWRIGERDYLPYNANRCANGGAMLRVRGDNLETSQGAKVPLSHAVRVFERARLCRDNGITWRRNGETIRVGNFTVDSLDASGTIRAGCHVIYWPEIEAAARMVGVI